MDWGSEGGEGVTEPPQETARTSLWVPIENRVFAWLVRLNAIVIAAGAGVCSALVVVFGAWFGARFVLGMFGPFGAQPSVAAVQVILLMGTTFCAAIVGGVTVYFTVIRAAVRLTLWMLDDPPRGLVVPGWGRGSADKVAS